MMNSAFSVSILCLVLNIFNVRALFVNGKKSLMAERLEALNGKQKLENLNFKSLNNFDFFTFAHAWPKTVCLIREKEEHKKCNKTLDLAGWTIHGLWPTRRNGKEPPFSCGGKKFSLKTLKPLMNDLSKYWPNLFTDTKPYELWKHEWDKHGTCAVSDKQTGNERLYFSKALELLKKIDITGVLRTLGVVPSDTKKYDIYAISEGLTKHFQGIKPMIWCWIINDVNYLDQIQICFDKQFKMVDCLKGRMTSAVGYESKSEMSWLSIYDEAKIDPNVQQGVYEMNGFKASDKFDPNVQRSFYEMSGFKASDKIDPNVQRGVYETNGVEASDPLTDDHIKACSKCVSYPPL